MKLVYSTAARDDLAGLGIRTAERILDKMDWFMVTPDPPRFAKPLRGLSPATHRFRIGDYCVTVAVQESLHHIVVIRVRHRREVYE